MTVVKVYRFRIIYHNVRKQVLAGLVTNRISNEHGLPHENCIFLLFITGKSISISVAKLMSHRHENVM